MKYLWKLDLKTVEQFFEIVGEVEKDLGRVLTRNEREVIFNQLMQMKNIKPSGATELTKEELWSQLVQNGKTILNIDETGYKIIKRKKEV